jgi:hypothetical protein
MSGALVRLAYVCKITGASLTSLVSEASIVARRERLFGLARL